MASSHKRLINDLESIEIDSDRKIPLEHYYIVSLSGLFGGPDGGGIKEFKKQVDTTCDYGKELISDLRASPESKISDVPSLIAPNAIYCSVNKIYLLFSYAESTPHQFDGRHQLICSHYASLVALTKKIECTVTIIEFSSRDGIITYLSSKVRDHILSLPFLGKKKAALLPIADMETIITEKGADLSPKQKYGAFFKLSKNGTGQVKLQTLSEILELRNIERYQRYFFD